MFPNTKRARREPYLDVFIRLLFLPPHTSRQFRPILGRLTELCIDLMLTTTKWFLESLSDNTDDIPLAPYWLDRCQYNVTG